MRMKRVPKEIMKLYGERRAGMSNMALQILAKIDPTILEDKLVFIPQGYTPTLGEKKDEK